MHRILLFGAVIAMSLTLQAGLAEPSSAVDFNNNGRSRSGAYIQSSGVCGGNFEFTVISHGFEYVRLGIVTPTDTEWLIWMPVPQNFKYRFVLSTQYLRTAYAVEGADWLGGRSYETVMVVTWFNRILNGDDYGTWYC